MTAHRIACASCGAPIGVPADVDHLTCVYCGASMVVQRGEGYVALKLAEEVGRAIEKTGRQTQASIREGTEVTQVELRRLQLSQELSAVQLQLSNVQAEMRSLEPEKAGRAGRQQMRVLRSQEASLLGRINALQAGLAPKGVAAAQSLLATRGVEVRPASPKDWTVSLFLCLLLGWLGVHRFYSGHVIIGIIQLLTFGGFGIWWLIDVVLILTNRYRDSRGNLLGSPNRKLGGAVGWGLATFFVTAVVCAVAGFDSASILLAFIAGGMAFAYVMKPEAAVWAPARRVLQRGHDKDDVEAH